MAISVQFKLRQLSGVSPLIIPHRPGFQFHSAAILIQEIMLLQLLGRWLAGLLFLLLLVDGVPRPGVEDHPLGIAFEGAASGESVM